MKKLISELTSALKQKFNQDLSSVVLFGSTVKGTSTTTSDIDILVVCESLVKDWRAREELTEDIEMKYATPIHMTLVSKEEISHAIGSAYPLMLEIYDANEIIKFFRQLLKDFEKNIHRWLATKIGKGVWKIPGMAVIESG